MNTDRLKEIEARLALPRLSDIDADIYEAARILREDCSYLAIELRALRERDRRQARVVEAARACIDYGTNDGRWEDLEDTISVLEVRDGPEETA